MFQEFSKLRNEQLCELLISALVPHAHEHDHGFVPNSSCALSYNPRRSCNDSTLSASLACENQERVLVLLGMTSRALRFELLGLRAGSRSSQGGDL
jgi:hypothetical protein